MAVYFEGKEVPASLVRTIISTSLSKIGIYHGMSHKFHAPKFQPDFEKLYAEASVFGYNVEATDEIVRQVLGNVGTEAELRLLPTIDVVGNNELPLLTHVKFSEDNNSETEMIYIGLQSFYVLASSRSTLMPGNIIKAREYPLNVSSGKDGIRWNFDIYADFNAKKPTVLQEYKKYQTWFVTAPVRSITVYTPPQLLSIIDEKDDEIYGGSLAKIMSDNVGKELSSLINIIEGVVDGLPDELPTGQPFPEYPKLLRLAKGSGINTYILNTLIENIEKRVKKEFVTTKNDWHLPREIIKQEKEEEERRCVERYNNLIDSLRDECANIRMRRVYLFFYASGRLTEASEKHLESICTELDELADKGFGVKGAARSRVAEALENSKADTKHNWIAGGVILGVTMLALFIAYSWVTASNSMDKFNAGLLTVKQKLDDDKFNEAKMVLEETYGQFKPGYLQFIVKDRTNSARTEIENSIDEFVANRIEQIQLMIKANRNRIDDFTWNQITDAMQLRPENEALLELREQYISQ